MKSINLIYEDKFFKEIKKGKLNSGFSSWEKYIEFLFYNQRKKEGTK